MTLLLLKGISQLIVWTATHTIPVMNTNICLIQADSVHLVVCTSLHR